VACRDPRLASLLDRSGRSRTERPGPALPALSRQSTAGVHRFPDLAVDGGFPFDACNIRCSSMRCKHPFKKSISSACCPTLRSNSAMRPSDQRRCPWPETHCPALAGTHCASDAAGAAISFPCWHDGAKQRSFGLTPREIEIVSTVVAGYSNKEIAEYFKIAEDTVKHHLSGSSTRSAF
jgi:hypothetical protein